MGARRFASCSGPTRHTCCTPHPAATHPPPHPPHPPPSVDSTYAKCCDADTHEPIDRGCWLSGNHKVVNADTCQSEEAFHDELTHWLHDRLKPIAIVLAVIAAVQLISILVTFYLIRAGKKAQRKSEDRRAPYGVLSGGDHAHNPHAGMPVRYE